MNVDHPGGVAIASTAPPILSTLNVCDEDTVLEADSTRSDEGFSTESLDLASLTSSIVDYEFENGRRYHAFKAGCYPLPNDENELDRLDLQHHVFTLLLNGEYHLAPLRNPTQILDIGTGTGLWAIEMGDRFPSATVTGVDLSPVQPTWVPDNVVFEIDDIESEWLWPENHFDHIHSRIMIGALGGWKEMIARAFTHCKPGGFLEIQELDPRLASDDGCVARSPYHGELIQMVIDASTKYGKPVPVHSDFKAWVEEAGFVDVQEYLFKIPCNSWPRDPRLKEVGKYQCLNYTEGYEAISIGLLTRVLGWTYVEFSVFMAKVRKELMNRSIHTYQSFAVIVGRKPYPHEIVARRDTSAAIEADTEAEMSQDNPYTSSVRDRGQSTDHPMDGYTELNNVSDSTPKDDRYKSSAEPTHIPIETGGYSDLPRPIPKTAYQYNVGTLPNEINPGEGGLVGGYSITSPVGRPNDFPTRPRPRNEY